MSPMGPSCAYHCGSGWRLWSLCKSRRACLAAVCFLLISPVSRSQTAYDPITQSFGIIAQSLSFLQSAPSGELSIGIVYPVPSQPAFAAARQIELAFGSGIRAGQLTLHPRLLTVRDAMMTTEVVALFLTDAALPSASEIAAATAGKGILTIASDPSVVVNGLVVMAVRCKPRTEIYVSRTAAQSAGVEFSTPFRLIIQER